MEQRRFDALAKALARPESRRRYLLGLLGVAVGGVGIVRGGLAKQGACRGLGDGCTMFTGCCSGLTCVVSGLNPNTGFCESGGTGAVSIEQPAGGAPSSASVTTAAQTPKSIRQQAQKATQEAKDDRKQTTKTARRRREKATQTARDRRINSTQTARERRNRKAAKTRTARDARATATEEARLTATKEVEDVIAGRDINLRIVANCSTESGRSFVKVRNEGRKRITLIRLETIKNESYDGDVSGQEWVAINVENVLEPGVEIVFRPDDGVSETGEFLSPVLLPQPFFAAQAGEGVVVRATNSSQRAFGFRDVCRNWPT